MSDEEKKIKKRKIFNYGLIVLLVILVFYVYFTRPVLPYYVDDLCPENKCTSDYYCIEGSVNNICIERNFYAQYWNIRSLYGYETCKLTIVGETDINFFGMTLKECSMLRWSCERPERYGAECLWIEENLECVCQARPWTGNFTEKEEMIKTVIQ